MSFEKCSRKWLTGFLSYYHGRMARGGHGIPKVSLGLAMPCRQTTPRLGSLRQSSTPLDTPRRMPMPIILERSNDNYPQRCSITFECTIFLYMYDLYKCVFIQHWYSSWMKFVSKKITLWSKSENFFRNGEKGLNIYSGLGEERQTWAYGKGWPRTS
jgi:hypothetical protein